MAIKTQAQLLAENNAYIFENSSELVTASNVNELVGDIIDSMFSFTGGTGGSSVYVTGGTYNASTGIATFTNTTGGSFSVSGFFTSANDKYVTGGTFSAGTAIFSNTAGGTFNVTGFGTVTTDIYSTGGTYNNSTGTATIANSTGGTFTITGFNTGSTVTQVAIQNGLNTYTGGTAALPTVNISAATLSTLTVSGATSLGTVSATTYYSGSTDLYSIFKTTDIYVTGGTYNAGLQTIAFYNTTGGTFLVTGISSGITQTQYWLSGSGSNAIIQNNGTGNISSGQLAVAANNRTTASGKYSFSMGQQTAAAGESSLAIGNVNNANGDYSLAGGSNNTVSGQNSFIFSSGSTLSGNRSVVLGGYQLTGANNDTVYVPILNILSAATSVSKSDILVRNQVTHDIEIGGNYVISVGQGSNILTGNTAAQPSISVVASPSFNNLTASGNTSLQSVSATTFYSGSTNLSALFAPFGSTGSSTFVQPGSNISTGGTAALPIINLVASPSVNGLTASGSTSLQVFTGTTGYTTVELINSRTLNSANPERLLVTDLNSQTGTNFSNTIVAKSTNNNYAQLNITNLASGTSASADIVATADNGNENINFVDMGINSSTFNGSIGVANDAYVYSTGNNLLIGNGTSNKNVQIFTDNVSTSPILTISSASTISSVRINAPIVSATTLSAGTYISGSTNLYQIFAPFGSTGSSTFVQPGTNTYTGGTSSLPTVNISAATLASLSVSGSSTFSSISATTVSASTFYSGTTELSSLFTVSLSGGNNISVAGTNLNPSIRTINNPNFNNLTASGTTTTPTIVGGSSTTQTLTYKTTTGVGATGSDHIFQAGTNGGTELMRLTNAGVLIMGGTTPLGSETISLQSNANTVSQIIARNTNNGTAARALVSMQNNPAMGVSLQQLGTGYTTSGILVQGKAVINSANNFGMNIGTSDAYPLQFWTNATQRIQIGSGGTMSLSTGGAGVGTAPLLFASGTNLTTAVSGTVEYNGISFFATRTGSTRETIFVGNDAAAAPATSSVGVIVDYYGTSATRVLTTPVSWAQVVINGTSYKLPLY